MIDDEYVAEEIEDDYEEVEEAPAEEIGKSAVTESGGVVVRAPSGAITSQR